MLEPGSTSSKKMTKLITRSMNKTLRQNEKTLDYLLEIAGDLEYLAIMWDDPQIHEKQLLDKRSTSTEKIPEVKLKCWRLAARLCRGLWAPCG